ncbi:phosphatidate cytidylyltransferase [Bacteroides sp. 519]|uniref:phosphatidate cytidylyltransferase n=1 Tax=Bacteroides sp. 519 TaxID=2302937 RepID=UPI0013D3DA05|nr:phosphatidate cytidylyltransferase [Bacteroides sp. 519]NDV59179.1 phosphatidate cytidylyltransferase [Bacteroides sp. 519]
MKSNFITRAITGLLFVVVLVGCMVYDRISFSVLFAIISALSVYEFAHLINTTGKAQINPFINMLGAVCLFIAFSGFCTNMMGPVIFIPYLIILMYLLISELYLKKEQPIEAWAYSMLAQVYIALPFALLNVLAYQYQPVTSETIAVIYNYPLPLAVFVFIWLSDTGAYCVGSLIGKHRLFERISPKKSWEGSIGGAVFAIASAFVFAHFYPFMTNIQWAGLAVVVVIFGTWGDLTESLLKRQLGVKDSGKMLPGHGGMLDRFDSSLMAIPAAVVYLYVLNGFN